MGRVVCVVALLAALLVDGGFAATPPVRVGVSLGLTGRYAPMATMQKRGYEVWVRHVNGRGGLAGRPVELVVADDGSRPGRAAELYEQWLGGGQVDLVFGPYSSAVTAAVAPVVERYGMPTLAAGASADSLWEQGYRYLFGVYTPASRYTVGFLELLADGARGPVALLAADDNFSQSTARGARVWARRFGVPIVWDETFPKGEPDLLPVLARSRAAGARVLMVCGHLDASVGAARGLARLGWRPDAYFATVGPVLDAYLDRLGPAAVEGTFSASQWTYTPDLPFPGVRVFHDDFVAAYGMEPSYHAATAYAAGQLLEAAVQRAGGLDRKRLRDTLAAMRATSVIGRYGVDAAGRQVRHFPVVIQWQGGRRRVVWPADLRTAEPAFGGHGP